MDADAKRRRDLIIAYHDGLRDGVRRYAWWKDGIQYVGSGVYTLADALSTIERDQERAIGP